VAERFGIISWPEEGLLTHTSETAVIARDGRLVALMKVPAILRINSAI